MSETSERTPRPAFTTRGATRPADARFRQLPEGAAHLGLTGGLTLFRLAREHCGLLGGRREDGARGQTNPKNIDHVLPIARH
jgi:hypothetical protein